MAIICQDLPAFCPSRLELEVSGLEFNQDAESGLLLNAGGTNATMPERERNVIWRLFTHPLISQGSVEWEELARMYLAQLHAGYGRFIKDPWWAMQIAELSRISQAFRELWTRHDVLNMSEGRKSMHHPLVGELTFDFLWFQTIDSGDLRLLIHTPRSNSGTAEKIERLLACESK